MTPEYIIADATVKYMNAKNPLEESLYYVHENSWCKDFNKATKYADSNAAIEQARVLNAELPVKILLVKNEGHRIGVGEIKF
jgi:hypothetical protein